MDEFTKTMEHWPAWLMFAFIFMVFVLQVVDKVLAYKSLAKAKKAGRRADDDGDGENVTHKDIYKELGRGTHIMEQLSKNVTQLNTDFLAHMQSDTNAQTAIMTSINQLREQVTQKSHNHHS